MDKTLFLIHFIPRDVCLRGIKIHINSNPIHLSISKFIKKYPTNLKFILLEVSDLNPLISELEKRKHYLEKLQSFINQQLKDMPQGKLRIKNNRGILRYYHITDSKDTIGKYIPKENQQIANQLAEKDYMSKLKKEVEAELRDIKIYLKKHNLSNLEDIYTFTNEYRRNGIYPGKNLIITYEADGSYLNVKEIREMVKEIFQLVHS